MRTSKPRMPEVISTIICLVLLYLTYDVLGVGRWFTIPPHKLARKARLPLQPPLNEISGIAQHLSNARQFWVHNDSLDQARIFLINDAGKLISEHLLPQDQQEHVHNIDWEDLTAAHHDKYDGTKVIYVADSGNNFHWRDDLGIYAFSEPQTQSDSLRLLRKYTYRFPHQNRHPPQSYDWRKGRCFDSEALFWWRHELFLIGKCVFGGPTTLWRLPREEHRRHTSSQDSMVTNHQEHVPEPHHFTLKSISSLAIKPAPHPLSERVTGATVDQDHDILAVLTYRSVWFFLLTGSPQKPNILLQFSCLLTQASAQPVRQAEAIEWRHKSSNHRLHPSVRSLLILTEGHGVHNLFVDFSSQECGHESPVL